MILQSAQRIADAFFSRCRQYRESPLLLLKKAFFFFFKHGLAGGLRKLKRDGDDIIIIPPTMGTGQPVRFDPVAAANDINSFKVSPLFSVVMPMYRTSPEMIKIAVESLRAQAYDNWELCAVDDCSDAPELVAAMQEYARLDGRIKFKALAMRRGISGASNEALSMASGDFIALLDHDDELTPDALYRMAKEIDSDPSLDWLFSDECKKRADGSLWDFFHKPGWNPEMLLNYMYTGHLTVYRRSLVLRAGGFRSEYDSSQDYDLALRISELTSKIKHIPRVLYYWRIVAGSAGQGDQPSARKTNIAALADAARRRGWDADVFALPTVNRVKFKVPSGRVSIIIPSDSEQNISRTVDAIRRGTRHGNYEIVVVTNSSLVAALSGSLRDVVWAAYDKPYNFSDKCDFGATKASGCFLVFFNDDVRPLAGDWLDTLLEPLNIAGVGGVSPKLIYENGTIQYAGMVCGVRDIIGTSFHAWDKASMDYFRMPQCLRDVSILSGACLAMRRSVFDELGGFDAVNTPIAHSDIDLCFKMIGKGYRCVYTPHSELTHIGNLSRSDHAKRMGVKKDKADIFLLKRWGSFISDDPLFPAPMRQCILKSPVEYRIPVSGASDERARPEGAGKDILFVTHDLSLTGAPIILFRLAAQLKKQGFFVVAASPSDGPLAKDFLDAGIPLIIDPPALAPYSPLIPLAKNFDRVVGNTVLCWRWAKDYPNPAEFMWWIHEANLVDQFAKDPLFKKTLASVNSPVVVPCELGANSVRKYRKRKAILIINYGIADFSGVFVPPKQDLSRRLRFIVMGTLEHRKGQDIAIAAFLNLEPAISSQVELAMIGNPKCFPDYVRHIARLAQGQDNIRILPTLSPAEALGAINGADIVLVPSRDDPFPIVAIEGMMFSKPCVVSTACGTAEVIVNGENGHVFQSEDAAMLAKVITGIVLERQRLSGMGEKARAVYLGRLTIDVFADKMLAAMGINRRVRR